MATFNIKPAKLQSGHKADVIAIVALRPVKSGPYSVDWYLTDDLTPDDKPYMMLEITGLAPSNWLKMREFVIADGDNHYWRVQIDKGVSIPPMRPTVEDKAFKNQMNAWIINTQEQITSSEVASIADAISKYADTLKE